MNSDQTITGHDEIRPLTGVRGVAAFFVILYHFTSYSAFSGSSMPSFNKGYLCVDLFFILSGFVLALRYRSHFVENASWSNYAVFLKARFARLYPAYFIFLFLYYTKWLINMSGTNTTPYRLTDLIANFLFIQSWGLSVRALISDSWSVSVEIFAYLLFPILLFLAVGRSIKTAAGLTLFAIMMLILIVRTGYGISGPLDAFSDNIRLLPLMRCLAEFSLGLIAYRITQTPAFMPLLATEVTTGIVLVFLGLVVFVDRTDLFIISSFVFLVTCLYYDGKISAALFGNRLVHHLGQISYSLYLLHPFFMGVAGHYKSVVPLGSQIPSFFVFMGIAATWFSAYLSYRFIEVPGRYLVNKIANGQIAALRQKT